LVGWGDRRSIPGYHRSGSPQWTHTWKNVGGVPERMSVTFIPSGIDGFFYGMKEIPHTDPRAPIIGEQYGIVHIGISII